MEKILKGIKKNLVHIISICIVSYFIFHLINGNRGLAELWSLQDQVEQAKVIFIHTQSQKQKLEEKVKHLRRESLNIDLLDEQVRKNLDYLAPDEIVIIDNNFQ